MNLYDQVIDRVCRYLVAAHEGHGKFRVDRETLKSLMGINVLPGRLIQGITDHLMLHGIYFIEGLDETYMLVGVLEMNESVTDIIPDKEIETYLVKDEN